MMKQASGVLHAAVVEDTGAVEHRWLVAKDTSALTEPNKLHWCFGGSWLVTQGIGAPCGCTG